MKLADIQIGGRYWAKVSGNRVIVRLTAMREVTVNRSTRTVFDAVNEATGRRLTIRSPQRLRSRVEA